MKNRVMMPGHGRVLALITMITAILGLTACDRQEFPKYNVLGGLRVLTVIADKPEASPGDTVTFTPILSDVNGAGRTISYSVQACIDPGVGIGAEPVCTQPDPTSLQSGTVVLPAGVSQTFTGPVSSFTLTLPDAATMFVGRRNRDLFNGVAYLVFYNISVTGGPSVNSFVRVLISDAAKTPKNLNPSSPVIEMNTIPMNDQTTIPTTSVDFRAVSPSDSIETYQFMSPDGSFKTITEELVTTWFVSDGTFDLMRTLGSSETAWTPPDPAPAGRGMVILVVTRDGHGGTSFRKLEMH